MPKIGGDIEQLAGLKRTFAKEAKTVHTLTTSINAAVGTTWWIGPAADRFKNEWKNEFAPTLRKLQEALDEASQHVEKRRAAIEQAGS